jgi:hypothetical protein
VLDWALSPPPHSKLQHILAAKLRHGGIWAVAWGGNQSPHTWSCLATWYGPGRPAGTRSAWGSPTAYTDAVTPVKTVLATFSSLVLCWPDMPAPHRELLQTAHQCQVQHHDELMASASVLLITDTTISCPVTPALDATTSCPGPADRLA